MAGVSSRLIMSFQGPYEILKVWPNNVHIRHWQNITDVRTVNVSQVHPYMPRDNQFLSNPPPPQSHSSVSGTEATVPKLVGHFCFARVPELTPQWRLCRLVEQL